MRWNNPFRDRIVLVGGTFPDSRDFFQTPHGLLPGVEVHANLVHMLVNRRFIQPSGWAVSLGLQLAVCLLAGVGLMALRPLAGTLLCIVAALLIGIPASYLVFHKVGYEALDLLQPDTLAGAPANTIVLLRSGLLCGEGLYQEARRELLAGIAADTNEPTLHLLMGHVYDRMGLKELAADAFEQARVLSTGRP